MARFVAGASRSDLDENRMLAFALVRAIEVVGEAAGRVTEETRETFPDLPWREMAGMRNRVIHAYFDIDLDRVWATVTDDMPALANRLRAILEQQS